MPTLILNFNIKYTYKKVFEILKLNNIKEI